MDGMRGRVWRGEGGDGIWMGYGMKGNEGGKGGEGGFHFMVQSKTKNRAKNKKNNLYLSRFLYLS